LIWLLPEALSRVALVGLRMTAAALREMAKEARPGGIEALERVLTAAQDCRPSATRDSNAAGAALDTGDGEASERH
jgi:hypothetical protein